MKTKGGKRHRGRGAHRETIRASYRHSADSVGIIEKYRLTFRKHDADMFGTVQVWKHNSLFGQLICGLDDAQELTADLHGTLEELK
jgi:hypothetical protein